MSANVLGEEISVATRRNRKNGQEHDPNGFSHQKRENKLNRLDARARVKHVAALMKANKERGGAFISNVEYDEGD